MDHGLSLHPDADDSWEIVARGTVDTDPEDHCEPRTTRYIVQIGERAWLWGLERNLADPVQRIEDHLADQIEDVFTPARCHCEHDCCGHRIGFAHATHIAGAFYAVAVHTSRNY